MGIKVEIKRNGIMDFANILKGQAARLSSVIAEQAAENMVNEIVSGDKTGIVYNGHQSSAPGESPANWEGDLVASIRADGNSVMADGEAATALEYGSVHMEARPFFWKSVEKAWNEEVAVFVNRMGAVADGLGEP